MFIIVYKYNIQFSNMEKPWVEKYRPQQFEKIILSDVNKRLLNEVIETGYFPNMLFYGSPGTGKTTTIINLIREYQMKHEKIKPEAIIHLNASDERGIETIRTQIYDFIHSKSFFHEGLKFVILDEVDYMTNSAQICLKNIITSTAINDTYNHLNNIRYCLICNYISRLEVSLQKEFLKLRFNSMNSVDIIKFLHNVIKAEGLTSIITRPDLTAIQQYFQNDIRGMINYIQTQATYLLKSKRPMSKNNLSVINNKVWQQCLKKIRTETDFINNVQKISIKYSISWNEFIIGLLYYFVSAYELKPDELDDIYDLVNVPVPNHIRIKQLYYFIYSKLK
jgi:DNA polymerase III delta prime subunit